MKEAQDENDAINRTINRTINLRVCAINHVSLSIYGRSASSPKLPRKHQQQRMQVVVAADASGSSSSVSVHAYPHPSCHGGSRPNLVHSSAAGRPRAGSAGIGTEAFTRKVTGSGRRRVPDAHGSLRTCSTPSIGCIEDCITGCYC